MTGWFCKMTCSLMLPSTRCLLLVYDTHISLVHCGGYILDLW